MKRYVGRRTSNGVVVQVRYLVPSTTRVMWRARRLGLFLKLRNHSPTGFEYGYAGSGPAQLALAILRDHTGDPEQTLRLYQRFKFERIATIPQQAESFEITSEEIDQWLRRQAAAAGRGMRQPAQPSA